VVGGRGIRYHVVVGFRVREDGPRDQGEVQAREEDW
jgi:hypothetical protein